jgi:hypothetical protein
MPGRSTLCCCPSLPASLTLPLAEPSALLPNPFQGECAVKYHPFQTLALNARTPYCVCAMCGGTGDQTCLNCLGEGVTYPS